MTTLTELNELQQQVQTQQEKVQELYSSIDYADDELLWLTILHKWNACKR